MNKNPKLACQGSIQAEMMGIVADVMMSWQNAMISSQYSQCLKDIVAHLPGYDSTIPRRSNFPNKVKTKILALVKKQKLGDLSAEDRRADFWALFDPGVPPWLVQS
jgi:hypothetical protein